jgi:FkbM family methyltransferase
MPRYPTLQHTLQLIKHISPSSLNYILDVGAQRETPFLMEQCKDSFHHLFEPVTTYHPDLEKNYQDQQIKYKLHKVALSDSDGIAYLHNFSEDHSGRTTHSYLSFEETYEHSGEYISKDTVNVARLDTILATETLPDFEYLIKMDVDGLEEKIVDGGAKTMANASFVIIEASLGRRNVISRLKMIEDLGYRLFDICDHAYYFHQMSQCDLVFINEAYRSQVIKFRPWELVKYKVQWKDWQHGFLDLEKDQLSDPFGNS